MLRLRLRFATAVPFRIGAVLRRTALLWALVSAGCARLEPIRSSPLSVPRIAKNAVVLDVMFVHFPLGDEELNGSVWEAIDELHFPAAARRRMQANGFRAGIISGPLPLRIERLLDLKERPDETAADPKPVDVDSKPIAKQRQVHLRGGRRGNVVVMGESERVPELSLLLRDDSGQVKGRNFTDVMGLFAIRPFPKGDGGIRLELTPELEHGQAQKRFVPGEGMFRVEFGPPHEVLDQLKIEAHLAPSQMLVLTARPDRVGSLGYRYFTEARGDATMQKMLIIRLAHCDADDRLSDGPIPADGDDDVKKLDLKVDVRE